MEHRDPEPTDWLGRPAPYMRGTLAKLLPFTPSFSDSPRSLSRREAERRACRNKAARVSRRRNRSK